jgi:ferredoxin
MRVTADRKKCCSSGMCVATAPDVFAQRESDGLVTVLIEQPPEALRAQVRRAVETCPVGAVAIEE